MMDLYSKLNSLAPKISYLSRDYGDQSNDNPEDFPPTDDPVYILGNKYSSLHELDDIRLDVRSNLWMTYRRNFPPISDTSFTSDSGWGCMLRCGQMVLARAFCNIHLGRNWRWIYSDYETLRKLLSTDDQTELNKYLLYREILKLFADVKTAPYSIHQIALMGVCDGRNVGQWYGPGSIAQVLRKLSVYDKMNNVHIYVALDNVVILDDIRKNCKLSSESHSESGESWKPLILFIPLRLGLSEINPIYFRSLKTTFSFPQTLGILGGRPNHALYFIGCCGDDLIYLDPHTTQPAVKLAQNLKEIEQLLQHEESDDICNDTTDAAMGIGLADDISYHCDRPYRMSISLLDPSLSLCFLCKTEEEFDQWANLVIGKLNNDEEHTSLFEILKQRPNGWPSNDDIEFCSSHCTNGNCCSSSSSILHNNNRNNITAENMTEEEILLQQQLALSDEEFEIID